MPSWARLPAGLGPDVVPHRGAPAVLDVFLPPSLSNDLNVDALIRRAHLRLHEARLAKILDAIPADGIVGTTVRALLADELFAVLPPLPGQPCSTPSNATTTLRAI